MAALEKRGRFAVVKPIFEPGEQVPLDRKTRVRENQIVWAEFRGGRARIIKNLGRLDNARDVCEALALERLGRRGFSKSLELAAEEDAANPVELAGRRQDLTGLPTFTVDPATARDFDDAVSAKAEGDSLRLWIHIADVAAYIRPGSELDAEAALRANSTYVPTSVEPMPKARAPKAPCVLVWLSPQTMVLPGCVTPSSGPMMCTMPRSSFCRPSSSMPNSAQFCSSWRICLAAESMVIGAPPNTCSVRVGVA